MGYIYDSVAGKIKKVDNPIGSFVNGAKVYSDHEAALQGKLDRVKIGLSGGPSPIPFPKDFPSESGFS